MLNLPTIRQLPGHLANQIAAGEVVERPASVVKELVENSLDAGATSIKVTTLDAGLTRLEITDNGHGMSDAQLPLALARHATSKIASTDDLFNIHTFGFRGEALPSIASVARLTLASRTTDAEHGWHIAPTGELAPASLPHGTRVVVEDLFYATPARRKFLKSARTERAATDDVLRKLALANPQVSFTLVEDGVESWHVGSQQGDFLEASRSRLGTLVGPDFAAAALPVQAARETDEGPLTLSGFISPPTLHASSNRQQYLMVNGRPVRDRGLQAALRQAYADSMAATRQPMCVLHLSLPASMVDVNVHPAKSEVRFKNPSDLFGFVYAACRRALGGGEAIGSPRPATPFAPTSAMAAPQNMALFSRLGASSAPAFAHTTPLPTAPEATRLAMEVQAPPETAPATTPHATDDALHQPLGQALGHIHSTYIVAHTAGGLVIIDQHAAHERLVYEGLKNQLESGLIQAQPLLIPAVVNLPRAAVETLLAHTESLAKLGLELESFSPTAVAVQAVPSLLGQTNPAPLLADLAEDLADAKTQHALHTKLNQILSTFACHHSIRAGRSLSVAEQNALLRNMETTPAAATCNHGRPTFMHLSLEQLAALFGR